MSKIPCRFLVLPACLIFVLQAGATYGWAVGTDSVANGSETPSAECDERQPEDAITTSDSRTDSRQIADEEYRLVWVQDRSSDGRDVLATGSQLRLMALDSSQPDEERFLSAQEGSYCKPLLSSDGQNVVYSDHSVRQVWVIPFAGGEARVLCDGFALDVWHDPSRRQDWVYVGEWIGQPESFRLRNVRRVLLEQPAVSEPVWSSTQISPDNFQLGAGGRYAAGEFPWPAGGIADLQNGTWQKRATGCWSSMAPDRSGVSWVFDGPHRNLQMFSPGNSRGWTIPVSESPGLGGHEAFHPRWSNDVRYFVVTGPYREKGPVNAISGGGRGVEIHIGRFRRDLQGVQEWLQVTENRHADFFPDLWLRGGGVESIDSALLQQTMSANAEPLQRLQVEVRCLETSQVPQPRSILPYRRALVVNRYLVSEVLQGELKEKQILIAHWGILDGAIQASARIRRGQRFTLQLEDYLEHRELAGERLLLDGDRGERRIFLDVTQGIPDAVRN